MGARRGKWRVIRVEGQDWEMETWRWEWGPVQIGIEMCDCQPVKAF